MRNFFVELIKFLLTDSKFIEFCVRIGKAFVSNLDYHTIIIIMIMIIIIIIIVLRINKKI